MRKKALLPQNTKAELPGPYRLYRRCKNQGVLWWNGNMAAQPHILMLEFEVCDNAYHAWLDQLARMTQRINHS